MPAVKRFLVLLLLLFSLLSSAQTVNGLCSNALMFCSGNPSQFPAGVNTGFAQQGPYYGCFQNLPNGNLPNPAWFIIPIQQSGPVVFSLSGTSDVDFVCWGPFSTPTGNCNNLTAGTIVPNTGGNHGCGSSPSATETVSIVNAHAGDYYVLLVSNYFNVNQQITFVQTNQSPNNGVVGQITVNGTDSLCTGQTATVQLTTGNDIQSLAWSGPGNFTGTGTFQTFPNMTATSVYTVVGTAVGNQTCSVTKRIKVLANPVPVIAGGGTVCSGSSAGFTVSGGSTYTWSGPGLGSSSGPTISISNAQPANAGVYSVIASSNICTGTTTASLAVNITPTITAGSNGNYCAGNSFSLQASGAGTYTWGGPNAFSFQGAAPSFANSSTALSGNYVVSGTANGCVSSATVPVTINALPLVVISSPGNGTVCAGTTAVFTVSGGTSYSWNGPSSFSSNSAFPSINAIQVTSSGNYSVLATLNSCTATGFAHLQVQPSPTVTATSNGDFCMGKSFSLQAAGANSYTWTGPNGFAFTGPGPAFFNNSLALAGQYTVNGSSGGCIGTSTIGVVINPLPNITILTSGTGTACVGVPVSFTATGGTSYVWNGPASFFSNLPSPSISNVQYSNAGTYSVLATLNTCTAVATRYLAVNVNPVVSATASGNFCSGKSINLMAYGATTYTWSGPNAFSFQGQNPLFLSNSTAMSGLYSVTGQANGCFGSGNINVSIFPLPNVTGASSGVVCQNGTFSLSAGGASMYSWKGPGNFSAAGSLVAFAQAQLAVGGIYTVTGTDLNGCSNTATVQQAVEPTPYITVNSVDACVNGNIQLSASGGSLYHWEGPAGFVSSAQSPVIAHANTFHSGVYNVTVTSSFGCVNTATVPATVYLNPVVSVTGKMEVCKGETFYFSASGALDYKWLGSTGIVTQNTVFSVSSTSPKLETTYTLVGMDGHTCTSYIPFYPIVKELPSARIVPATAAGCAPLCTDIVLEQHSGDIVSADWRFSDKETFSGTSAPVHKCLPAPGIYDLSIRLTDAMGCVNVITNTLQAYATPKADFSFTPDQPTDENNVVTFSDQTRNAGVANWSWTFYSANGSVNDSSLKASHTIAYGETGSYLASLKVSSADGCTDSITRIIVIADEPTFFIPNAFTPNGDGLNDVFVPKSRAVLSYEMEIYDRWGQMLYSSADPLKGWDGKKDGEQLPTDTYVYRFTVSYADKNPKVYKGQFSLIK